MQMYSWQFARAGRGGGGAPLVVDYSTNFATGTQNPLSQGGIWHSNDPNSTPAQISGTSKCHGTQSGSTAPPYNDSQSFLNPAGWGTTQDVTLTVDLAGGLDSTNREVEILLRARDDNSSFGTIYGSCTTTGYEINWQHQGGYLILGRFKQSEIDRIASPPPAASGSTFRVRTVNNGSSQPVFQVWINGVLQTWQGSGTTSVTDVGASPPLGAPGIGFWKDSSAANNEFWATSFAAVST